MLPQNYSKGIQIQGQIQLEYVTGLKCDPNSSKMQRGDMQGVRAIISEVKNMQDVLVEKSCPVCGHEFLHVCEVCDYSDDRSSEKIFFFSGIHQVFQVYERAIPTSPYIELALRDVRITLDTYRTIHKTPFVSQGYITGTFLGTVAERSEVPKPHIDIIDSQSTTWMWITTLSITGVFYYFVPFEIYSLLFWIQSICVQKIREAISSSQKGVVLSKNMERIYIGSSVLFALILITTHYLQACLPLYGMVVPYLVLCGLNVFTSKNMMWGISFSLGIYVCYMSMTHMCVSVTEFTSSEKLPLWEYVQ